MLEFVRTCVLNVYVHFSALIIHDYFLSRFVGNTFWLVALGYYVYITFLGYASEYN